MWTMPQLPPELLAMLSRGNGANGSAPPAAAAPMNSVPGAPGAFGPPKPIQMGPGGTNLNRPTPPDPAASPGGMVAGANVPAASPFTRTQQPKSSDDPGITGMPVLPTPPDTSNNPMSQAYSRYQDIEKTRPQVPDASKLKPKWWERLAGAGVGFASGWGNAERGAQLGGEVTTRRYGKAMSDYTHQNAAVDERERAEREAFPLAEAQSKLPQTDFQNKFELAKEKREQFTAQSNADNKSAIEGIRQQLADLANTKASDQKEMALNKLQQDLELKSKGLDLKQMSLEQQRQLNELSNQLKQQKLENDQAKFATGTDAKSLEDERKARLTSIENDWKQHPYWNKLTGDKNKEIQAVNDDINQRLSGVRQAGGQPRVSAAPSAGGSTTSPAPQTHSWSKNAWAHANPGKDVTAAEQMATKRGFQVVP